MPPTVRQLDHWHLRHTQLPRREQPSMSDDDAVLAVYQNRVGPAELADRGGDLRHLSFRVRPRIARIGDQRRKRAVLDGERQLLGCGWNGQLRGARVLPESRLRVRV